MKNASDFVKEANKIVERVPAEDAVSFWTDKKTIFIDVRDSAEIANSGTIKDALCINRGMLEFVADESTKYFNNALKKDLRICVLCAAGGRAALAGKTLKEMGYKNVLNIGGFKDWKEAGGATEKGDKYDG